MGEELTLKSGRLSHHRYRVRFAFLPVRRWLLRKSAEERGWYWWRIVIEVRSGVLNEWTAYARHNDELITQRDE